MTSKEYIESGIIEAYVLGMLSPEEEKEVEQKAQGDPAVLAALQETRETMGLLAQAHSVTPPPEWKDSILNAALGQQESPAEHQLKPEYEQKSTSAGTNWLAIAATVVLLLSLGINALQYRHMQIVENELLNMEMRLASLELENESMVANYREMEENLAMLRDPATATFVMKGVEGKSQSLRADVFWNAASEKVFLDVKNLPNPPTEKQYQLWALQDGNPVDMGVFSYAELSHIKNMGQIAGADAFAITLEPAGGSLKPTMDQMYVYGEPIPI